MKHINLIRKIAWSFHNTTGVEWDDLFGEASLAYSEAIRNYDSDKGSISCYMWIHMKQHLINYLHKEQRRNGHIDCLENLHAVDRPEENNSWMENLSKDAVEIVDTILGSPKPFIAASSKMAQKRIARVMQRKGWSLEKTLTGIQDLQLALE